MFSFGALPLLGQAKHVLSRGNVSPSSSLPFVFDGFSLFFLVFS